MKLTEKQQLVLDELRNIGQDNAHLYRDSKPYLHQKDCEKLALGDQACKLGYAVRYTKMRELLSEILQSRADGSYRSLSNRLARTSPLIIDEWLRELLSSS